jgi:thiol-disulfide isomerase/thioredoxin
MKILRFGAIWCPGCLVMKHKWREIEKEINIDCEDYDYDEDKMEVEKWGVGRTLPVYIFIDKEGNELLRLIGEQSKSKLIDIIIQNNNK